mmetsp:Transcript_52807/g.72331  ORF Transcript_52807/g.72331 Transcript_52807/m.72331 type:complete len:112 (+) Transcript_52807:72-407(+)
MPNGKYYKFNVVMFGNLYAPQYIQEIMSHLSSMVYKRLIRKSKNGTKIYPKIKIQTYIDDTVIAGQSYQEVKRAGDMYRQLMAEIGLPISEDKSDSGPKKKTEWLGFDVSK